MELNKEEQQSIKEKIDDIHKALVGDDYGNKGLIKRVEEIEKKQEKQEKFHFKLAAALSILGAIWYFIVDYIKQLFK